MQSHTPNHRCGETTFRTFPDRALDGSIGDRFAEQVARHRDCVALVDRDGRLTYRQLDAWANGVAHRLVGDIEPVALVLDQGAPYAAAVSAR